MTGPARATVESSDVIDDAAPLQLTHTEAALAHMRGDVIGIGTPAAAPFDIVTTRMHDLAARLLDARREMDSPDDDATLGSADAEIAPVSRAAIIGLRALRITETDDDAVPTSAELTASNNTTSIDAAESDASGLTGPSLPASAPPIGIGYALSDQTPTVPLRLSDGPRNDITESLAIPADAEIVAEPVADVLPALADAVRSSDLLQQLDPTRGFRTPQALQDETPTDIRLVDLIRRQQVLLEQLNSYPSAPPALAPPPPLEPEPSADRDDSAATSHTFPEPPTAETIVPIPPPPVVHGEADDDDETAPHLPERSPMIIERARAERSGLYGQTGTPAVPSAIPAFAAGIAVALVAAGTLFYLL